ncbi:autophagy regulatory protein [Grosmannia clavigera kw1407]|uniref:Autophagy-related protein 2 n=1 Tax=Grosmannia clavigera (strain kw1407 / UAMH 11150) TaxID=655863 RepID=F0XGA4_GROCL|nr:autophagy regulatory protein [Grosmannia clavigera kw1407]EFX03188.1 autophagy regulatory protein [Grosmannia clavigera kw1407]
MTSLFDSFRNSSMPKRLLRYALSRFDVLDADALDLDNLDLAWGRNTVLEFRDVGLRVKKLQQILQLPPTFHIRRAKVGLLRVTLPVDIYSSPIQIRVSGVDVRLSVSAREDDHDRDRRKDSKTAGGSSGPTAEDAADADADVVPSAVDLAQSFLEHEPSGEARALEAVLAAEASLDQSTELDSDDDTISSSSQVLGTGQALTLPAFLADFLQGIVDRIQVIIEGVAFQLEVDVPVTDDAASATANGGSEPVTFQLTLARINVEGVTTAAAAVPKGPSGGSEPAGSSARPKIVPKEGKRHISLDHVRAFLISETNVFSALDPSPSMPSSAASQSPVLSCHDLPSLNPTAPADPMTASSILARSQYPLQDSEDAFNIPYDDSEGSGDDNESNSLDGAEPEVAPASSLSTPRASVYGEHPRMGSFPPTAGILHHAQSAILDRDRSGAEWNVPKATECMDTRSEPSSGHLLGTARSTGDIHGLHVGLGLGLSPNVLATSLQSMAGPGSAGSAEHTDDYLSQSHVYSHEEAESMYLSAFSQADSDPMDNPMPGGWHTEDDDASQFYGSPPAGLWRFGTDNRTAPAESAESAASGDAKKAPTALPGHESEGPCSSGAERASGDGTKSPDLSAGAQSDEAATPKGPTRLVKELLSLEYISIYVPSNHKHDGNPQSAKKQQERLEKSVSPHFPGAFSIYSSAGMASTYGHVSIQDRLKDSYFDHRQPTETPPADSESVEVNLAPLEICFDASIGFLLAKVVLEILQSLKSGLALQQQQKKAPRASATPVAQTALPHIKIHGDKIALLFLDKLAGVTDTAERFFESPQGSGMKSLGQSRDVLLQVVLENLTVSLSQRLEPWTSSVSVDLQRFRFGYADADIISFDRRIQMRSSVRDAFPPSGDDVSIKLIQSSDATKCEISTLPLLFSMDLQRLDETFSWFGGLSSFLSLGSSISSAASGNGKAVALPKAKPEAAKAAPKARGVRFETPISPDDKSTAAENKVDMRIGGVHLELVGRDCRVALDTSAVKLVSREEGIGVGVSRIRLAGPYLRNSGGTPPVTADIANTRLEFLNVPKDKDLERLLELITPSKVKFDEREDVIMVDTLLRQRRSGPLLRLNVDDVSVQAHNLAQLSCLPALGEEVARLASVAKYLPEDDRPGLLTLGMIRHLDVSVDIGGRIGHLQAVLADLEVAHITLPSLVSTAVGAISVHRNQTEELIGSSSVPAHVATTGSTATAGRSASSAMGAPPLSGGISPALMMRIIGDDLEPVIKVKMWGLNFEYRVPTIMDVLGLAEDATPQDFEESLAASVANLGEQAQTAILSGRGPHGSSADKKDGSSTATAQADRERAPKPTTVDVSFRDCVLGLNPLNLTSKLNLVLVDARLEVVLPQGEEVNAVAHLSKMSLLLIDDVTEVGPPSRASSGQTKDMVRRLCSQGFVDICQLSAARISVHVSAPDVTEEGQRMVELEVRDDLLVLETCADSTQTLIGLANALTPPTPPSTEIKFKTEVMPVKDLLASISIDAFGRAEGNYDFDEDFVLEEGAAGEKEHGTGSDDDFFYGGGGGVHGQLNRAAEQSVASLPSVTDDDLILDDEDADLDIEGVAGTAAEKLFSASSVLEETTRPGQVVESTQGVDDIEFDHGFFGTATETAAEGSSPAHRWNSVQNGYDKGAGGGSRDSRDGVAAKAPLRLRVRDVHVIWNLFDGYDWQHTRDVITQTVQEVEAKAYERRTRNRRRSGHDEFSPYADEEEEDAVIGDFLFNSIYIGIPANHDPRELTQAINQNIYGDTGAETESVAATTVTATSSRAGGGYGGHGGYRGGRPSSSSSRTSRRLNLQRSRRHKITFELGGVGADVVVFPAGSGETQTAIDVRIRDLDVFDHVPTSTWKKFATYDRDAGERPIDGDMVRIEVLVVKPVPELAATELVLKTNVLPLRLHVDQDALDFITRFFEFKDDSKRGPTTAEPSTGDEPFIQRAEIHDIPVQLDFKPKRVDYAGLRSGHTTEFMNFLILDGSRMTMRHTIIYGVSGFERLGQTLNDIWMPDIKRHQLPGVLAGLAPVRSLVTVGSGFRDLIEIPIQEYRHNGRIVRSISKGAMAFARSTGTELVKLGAKVATGTQGEDGMGGGGGGGAGAGAGAAGVDAGDLTMDDDHHQANDDDNDERKQISLYADQPAGVVQGLRHAYSSLARDLNIARDAVIAVPAEVRESTSATGAARVVIRHAPTIIFRPAIGATKAIGQTLMGATNSLDPQNLRRAEDKYKSGPGRV